MSKTRFELSREYGVHNLLNTLVGDWRGVTYSWLEPTQSPEKFATDGTISPLAGGRFLLYEYGGSYRGELIKGAMIFGHDLARNLFQSVWVDSFHTDTGIICANGKSADHLFSAQGRFGSPEACPPWHWRTEIDLTTPNRLQVNFFAISPEGAENKTMESRLKKHLSDQ